jgi:hypothetical protein
MEMELQNIVNSPNRISDILIEINTNLEAISSCIKDEKLEVRSQD